MISLFTAALLMAAPGDPESALPTTLSPIGGDEKKIALGLHLGYLQIPDADDATVFYGIHLRWSLIEWLAVEGSIDIAESDFENNAAELSIVPVQVTAIFKPFQGLPIHPYGLAGIGWYFTDVEYSAGLPDDSSDVFGVHLGVGAELPLGDMFMLHADFRWIFMGEPDYDNPALDDEDVDYWQLMIGASLRF